MSLDFWASMVLPPPSAPGSSALPAASYRTGGLRQLQKSWRESWMSPRSSPTWVYQLPFVESAILERSIQGKANWIKGSYTSPVKITDQEGALWPLSTHSWLSCTAKPPHSYWGSKALHTLCLATAQLCFPPPGAGDPSFSLFEPGRKISPEAVGHCCSHGAKLGGDADLLLMFFQTSDIISKPNPCFKAQS